MSRSHYFLRGLGAAYLLILCTSISVMISVPVALHYLDKEAFGIWVVVTQISGYLLMLEFGTSGSGIRLLMDHKDHAADGQYGTMIKTLACVQTVQAVILLLAGLAATPLLVRLLDVPSGMAAVFQGVWMSQVAVLSISFLGRIGSQLLTAHHRADLVYHSQSVLSVVNIVVMWLSFRAGTGLYSMVLANGIAVVLSLAVTLIAAKKLHLFAPPEARGRVSRPAAKALFSFGGDLFFLAFGLTLLGSSQAPIITRVLGFEMAAVWGVATKLFTMAQQVVGRLLDSSASSLMEMVVRKERERLQMRFQDILALTAALALWAATTAAVCNGPLLEVWTRGRIAWPWINDVLMGAVLASMTITRMHIGLAGTTKIFRGLQFVYFFEGLLFAVLAYVMARRFGLAGILMSALFADILGAGVFGSRRTAAEFGTSAFTAGLRWLAIPLRGGAALIALAALHGWVTRHTAAWPTLI
ncbi:MAG TPA: hypothetical protein VK530_15055, partial [Candidatus Acidoferrum sp.]|nr:hypothetical protein [Candidatus Acidoferrum sp.]